MMYLLICNLLDFKKKPFILDLPFIRTPGRDSSKQTMLGVAIFCHCRNVTESIKKNRNMFRKFLNFLFFQPLFHSNLECVPQDITAIFIFSIFPVFVPTDLPKVRDK